MPATHLRCRNCGADVALDPVGTCARCWGPLEPVYDLDEVRPRLTRERISDGHPSLWRYADLLPVAAPAEPRLAPGLTPLVEAPKLAEALGLRELRLKLDTANPTHSFKDRVVAVAAAKALEAGMDTLACSSTGNLAGAVAARAAAEGLAAAVFCPLGLEREKLAPVGAYGATLYEVRGSYDDCSRLTVELSFELPWGFVNVGLRSYYAEGSKTVAFEIAEQLGWTPPDVVVCPVASGSLLSKVAQGFAEFRELGLTDGPVPRIVGAQAEGCSPVAAAFAEERPVTPVQATDDGDVARDRQPRRRQPCDRRCPRVRGLDPCSAGGRDPGQHDASGRALGRLRRGGGRDLPRRAAPGSRRGFGRRRRLGGAPRHGRRPEDARPRRGPPRPGRDRRGRGRPAPGARGGGITLLLTVRPVVLGCMYVSPAPLSRRQRRRPPLPPGALP